MSRFEFCSLGDYRKARLMCDAAFRAGGLRRLNDLCFWAHFGSPNHRRGFVRRRVPVFERQLPNDNRGFYAAVAMMISRRRGIKGHCVNFPMSSWRAARCKNSMRKILRRTL